MRFKTISIIVLLILCGCGSQRDPEADAALGKFGQLRQQCLSAGYADHSQEHSNCMNARGEGHPAPTTLVDDQDADFKQLAAAVKHCDQLLAAKKLKNNYERGKCMNAAFEKYAFVHPPSDKAAFDTFQTDILLIMVRLDKKEVTKDEAQVIMRQSANKLAQAENAAVAETQRQKAAWAQQAYQSQVQQQQYEAARSAAMLQGFSNILQNQMQQNQRPTYVLPAYVPSPPVTTTCNTFYGTTTCRTQ